MTPEQRSPNADIPFLESVRSAIRTRPQLVALPVLVFVIAAILAGLLRSPVYTATAEVTVADHASASRTSPGYQDGVENVANATAQMIGADAVVTSAASALGERPAAVAGRISAEAVPATPFVSVDGTGEDAEHAIGTANAAAAALAEYATGLSAQNPTADVLGERYSDAARAVASTETRLRAAQAAFNDRPSPATRRRLVDATAARDDARLQADALGGVYRESLRDGAAPSTASVLTPATMAGSDRLRTAAAYFFVALIAGAMLGVALAVLMASTAREPEPVPTPQH